MKHLSVLILLLILLFGCEQPAKQVPIFEEKMFVMGTIVDITIADEDEQTSQKAFHDLLTDFKYMQAAWNPWKRGSLARINQLLPMKSTFSVGPALKEMIDESTVLAQKSDGLFNPAIGKLVKLWQFHTDEPLAGPPPSDAEIKKLLDSNLSMAALNLSGLNLIAKNENILLDFGGFAKGVGVDKAIEYLKSVGIENAIVNAGGDLRAIGSKGGKPWRIGIRNPQSENIIATLQVMGDESVFTSGDYERFYEYQGKRYHHILDPRTGYPAMSTRSVTVVHNDASVADAAATALFVAGPALWEKIAKQMGITQVMLIDQTGHVYITDELNRRISFVDPDKLSISVVTK